MKHTAIHIITLALACAPVSRAQVQAPPAAPPSIQVSGSAEIKVAPDLVDISLGVEVANKDLLPAQEDMKKKVAAVIECLKKAGLEDKDIQTDYVSIRPNYGDSNSRTKPLRYELNRSISCTLRDVSKFEAVLTSALQAGATDVSGITFRTTELRKHKDAARLAALRAAREKAELMAKEVDMKLGAARQVTEEGSGVTGSLYARSYYKHEGEIGRNSIDSISAGAAEGSFAAGQISISANVTVTFALQ